MSEEKNMQKILLIDDDNHLLITLGDFLRHQGYAVETAISGEEGLKKLPDAMPDLIILDMSMPGMGGIGFLKKLAPEGGVMPYPVLVFTARGIMREFFNGLDVAGFLAKPCEQTQLIAEVRRIMLKYAVGKQHQARVMINHQRTVLIADDSQLNSIELNTLFHKEGYQTILVSKGPEVIEKAVKNQPDAILMKRYLTGMNGDAVTEILKRMQSTEGIPVVLFDDSSAGGDDATKMLQKCGARTFIHTFSVAVLLKAINEIFEQAP